jgi:hypothetical protein
MALWPVEVRRTARGQGDKAKVSRADGRVAGSPIKCTRNRCLAVPTQTHRHQPPPLAASADLNELPGDPAARRRHTGLRAVAREITKGCAVRRLQTSLRHPNRASTRGSHFPYHITNRPRSQARRGVCKTWRGALRVGARAPSPEGGAQRADTPVPVRLKCSDRDKTRAEPSPRVSPVVIQ